jgi:hypothetical protein
VNDVIGLNQSMRARILQSAGISGSAQEFVQPVTLLRTAQRTA